MMPIIFTVLLLSITAVSSVPKDRNGGEETNTSTLDNIEQANANLLSKQFSTSDIHSAPAGSISHLTYGDIMTDIIDDDGIVSNAVPCTSGSCLWNKTGNEVLVPYRITGFSGREKRIIQNAMNDLESGTCIRFVRKSKSDSSFVTFISGTGCWSYLGRQEGGQQISLQKNGCLFKDIVQHEILHALGYHHEQVRSDRDDNVIINFENIISGRENNFAIATTNNLDTDYDFNSVMHYGQFAFSKNGLATITPISSAVTEFGTATEMSANDFLRVNRLYQCFS
ncbi:high choriolytic enzyme 1-like [Vanacampus margaritifer]